MQVDLLVRELQAAARDTSDVQQIVDEAHFEIEIPPCRVQCGTQWLGGERDQPAIRHRRDDRRERGSQLVAQCGEEVIFGVGTRPREFALARQLFTCVFGIPALLFEFLSSGDVDQRRSGTSARHWCRHRVAA